MNKKQALRKKYPMRSRTRIGKFWFQVSGYGISTWDIIPWKTKLRHFFQGFNEYGTYYYNYKCWKQKVSFQYKGHWNSRIPLYECLFLILFKNKIV